MNKDHQDDLREKGPGPDNIPDADPRYEDTDPGSFDKLTRDNLESEEPLLDDPEDSEELDK